MRSLPPELGCRDKVSANDIKEEDILGGGKDKDTVGRVRLVREGMYAVNTS